MIEFIRIVALMLLLGNLYAVGSFILPGKPKAMESAASTRMLVHLRALEESGAIKADREAAERFYDLDIEDPSPLGMIAREATRETRASFAGMSSGYLTALVLNSFGALVVVLVTCIRRKAQPAKGAGAGGIEITPACH
jgi:hypothetical protein